MVSAIQFCSKSELETLESRNIIANHPQPNKKSGESYYIIENVSVLDSASASNGDNVIGPEMVKKMRTLTLNVNVFVNKK